CLLTTMSSLPAAALQLGHDARDVLLHGHFIDATRLLLLLVLRLAPAVRGEALGLDAHLATRARARRRCGRRRALLLRRLLLLRRRRRRPAKHVRRATQAGPLLRRRHARRTLLRRCGRLRLGGRDRLGWTLGFDDQLRGRFLDRFLLRLDTRGLHFRDRFRGHVLALRFGCLGRLGRDRFGRVRCRRGALGVRDDLFRLPVFQERRLLARRYRKLRL